jgi:catechol 2,3-dioxygenase-like lactoylglutathione lyase family enzyme
LQPVRIRFDHVRLDVSDIEAAERFYSEALGLRLVVRYTVGDRVIAQMGPDGALPGVELWMEGSRVPEPHPTHHIAFSVADVRYLVERVRKLGYFIIKEPFMVDKETVAFIADPDNHIIEINDFVGRGIGESGALGPCHLARTTG